MKKNLIRAGLVCTALLFAATPAMALAAIIAGAIIGFQGKNLPVQKGQTDAKGQIRFTNLVPGEYQLVIDGPSLKSAVDRIPAPKGKASAAPAPDAPITLDINLGSLGRSALVVPYCADMATQGIQVAFTVPDHGQQRSGQLVSTGNVVINSSELTVTMTIFDRWGNQADIFDRWGNSMAIFDRWGEQ